MSKFGLIKDRKGAYMKKRRMDLLKKKNSKIVIANIAETEPLLDLIVKGNDIFAKLKKLAGVSIEFEDVDMILEQWGIIMIKTSDTLSKISQKIEVDYIEPASISLLKNQQGLK